MDKETYNTIGAFVLRRTREMIQSGNPISPKDIETYLTDEVMKPLVFDLDTAIDLYNHTTIDDNNRNMLPATARLKEKLETLPDTNHINARSVVGGTHELKTKITENRLRWYTRPTHPNAIIAGGILHLYEEAVLPAKTSEDIDLVIDSLIEMLIMLSANNESIQTPLLDLVRNQESMNNNGGLDWVDRYNHLSPILRKIAGCK